MLMPKKVKMKNKKKKGEDLSKEEPEEESDDVGFREESDEGEGFSDFED